MSDVAFPSKEEADELTLNELMQAIAMAGLYMRIEIMDRWWLAGIADHMSDDTTNGDFEDTPRAALDSACEAWRKEASNE